MCPATVVAARCCGNLLAVFDRALGDGVSLEKKDESTESLLRQMGTIALPTFGQLIAEPVFALADTAIVGHVSSVALAGLSLGSTIILTAVGLCVFLAYSTTSRVSRLLGSGNRREGMQAGVDGMWLSVLIGGVLAVALTALARPLALALGGEGEVLEQATTYARAAALGVPGMLIAYAANGVYRGMQRTGYTFVVAALGAALNIGLDLILVIVLGWGVLGSGVATGIAQWFVGVCLLVPMVRWARLEGVSLAPRREGIASASGDGAPLFLRTLALRAGIVATVMAATSMGTAALASYQVVNSAWGLALNALDSLAIAGQTLVGQRLGARDRQGALRLTRLTARTGLVGGVVVGTVFVLAGAAAPELLSPAPEVQRLATIGMAIMGLDMPLQGWMFALDGILIGAGDFRYLAATVSLSALAHAIVLAALSLAPFALASDTAGMTCLWLSFCIVFMGARGLANGHRTRGEAWMR